MGLRPPEGRAFGDVPLNLEYKLEVWDSPNSAGIIIDAIRAAKIAKEPLSVTIRVKRVTPWAANQTRARKRNPIAVFAVSSSRASV